MSVIADTVYERIQEVERQRAVLDDELAALNEIHEIARTRLNGGGFMPGGIVPSAQASGQAAPSGQTQPPAVPPKRKPAPRPARKNGSTSAGRRSQPHASGQAHTAKGAPAGGRREAVKPVEIADSVREALRKLGPTTPNAIGLHLGYPKSTSGMVAVREVVAKLVGTGEARVDGQVRGRPAYSLVEERQPPQSPAEVARSATVLQDADNPVDELLDRMAAYLAENGPRRRDDLKEELGQPFEEEFRLALDRGITLKRIQKVTQMGGRVVYRHMGGER